jgi:hypothetical protein
MIICKKIKIFITFFLEIKRELTLIPPKSHLDPLDRMDPREWHIESSEHLELEWLYLEELPSTSTSYCPAEDIIWDIFYTVREAITWDDLRDTLWRTIDPM